MPKTSTKNSKDDKVNTEKTTKKDIKKNSKKTSKKDSKKKPKKLKIYCGIEQPLPKNFRLGSMEECLNAGKVNYYGIKKIDSRLIEAKRKEKEGTVTLKQLQMELMGFLGKENRLKKDLAIAKTAIIEEKIKKEMDDLKVQKFKLVDKINELKNKKK